MNETTILLAPAPDAKPEFLATVEPLPIGGGGGTDDGGGRHDLPFDLILDNYTRDPWATSSSSSGGGGWRTVYLKSVDGRKKLPGFLEYLKKRRKSSYGTFDSTNMMMDDDGGGGGGGTRRGVFVVPFDQPPIPPSALDGGGAVAAEDVVVCRYALDERRIEGLRRPAGGGRQRQQQQQQPKQRSAPPPPPVQRKPDPKSRAASGGGGGGGKGGGGGRSGLLGNLLGAQRRTNKHLSSVPSSKKKEVSAGSEASAGGGGEGGCLGGGGGSTSGEVVTSFRTQIEKQLCEFRDDPNRKSTKVRVSLSEIAKDLSVDQKEKVTMDVLRYVVYEQAEEIGMDRWVAAKEPSEFVDENVIAVYKEGEAPQEVLEDMNKGDLPDEIRGQQRALADAKMKQQAKKEAKKDALIFQQTLGKGANMDVASLNQNKRDRRTIEEIQRDMMTGTDDGAGKRSRFE